MFSRLAQELRPEGGPFSLTDIGSARFLVAKKKLFILALTMPA